MNKEYLIFECRKCGHNLYVSKDNMIQIVNLPDYSCPECGEEGDGNWIIIGDGNFEEYKKEIE